MTNYFMLSWMQTKLSLETNTRVGQSLKVLGKVRMGNAKINGNLLLLLFICTEHKLVITNTYFKHKQIHKNSWMHPRSKHRQYDLHDFTGRKSNFIITNFRIFMICMTKSFWRYPAIWSKVDLRLCWSLITTQHGILYNSLVYTFLPFNIWFSELELFLKGRKTKPNR